MFDTVKSVFRHPIFEANHATGECDLPVAQFRPARKYAHNGVSYTQEFRAVYDFATHGGGATTTFDLGVTCPLGAIFYSGEAIFLLATTGAGSLSFGVASLLTGVAELLAATAATAIGTVLPLKPTYAGAGEFTLAAAGNIVAVSSVGTITAGRVLIQGSYAMSS
jgi:hypothetical protein